MAAGSVRGIGRTMAIGAPIGLALMAIAGPALAQTGDDAVKAEFRARLSSEEIALMGSVHTAETYRNLLRRSQQHLANREYYQAYALANDVELDDFQKNLMANLTDTGPDRLKKPEVRLSMYLQAKAVIYWTKFNLADCKRYFAADYDLIAKNGDKYSIANSRDPMKAALFHAKLNLDIMAINRDAFQKDQLEQINDEFSQTRIDLIDQAEALFGDGKTRDSKYIDRLAGTGLLGLKYDNEYAGKDLNDVGRELGSKGFEYLAAHRYYEAMVAFSKAHAFFEDVSRQNMESRQTLLNDELKIAYYPDVREKLIAGIYYQKAWVAWCAADAADCRKFAESPVLKPEAAVNDPSESVAMDDMPDTPKDAGAAVTPDPVEAGDALDAKYPVQKFYMSTLEYPLDELELDPATPEATLAQYRETCTALRIQAAPLFDAAYRKAYVAAHQVDPDLAGSTTATPAAVCDESLKQAVDSARDSQRGHDEAAAAKLNAAYAQVKPTLTDHEPKKHPSSDADTTADPPEPFYGPEQAAVLVTDAGPRMVAKGLDPAGPLMAMSRLIQDSVRTLTVDPKVDDATVESMVSELRRYLASDEGKTQDSYATSVKPAFVDLFHYTGPGAKAAVNAMVGRLPMTHDHDVDPATLVHGALAALEAAEKAHGGSLADDRVSLAIDAAITAQWLHRDPVQTSVALVAAAATYPAITLDFNKRQALAKDAQFVGQAVWNAIQFGKDPAAAIPAARAALKSGKDEDFALTEAIGITKEQMRQAGFTNAE